MFTASLTLCWLVPTAWHLRTDANLSPPKRWKVKELSLMSTKLRRRRLKLQQKENLAPWKERVPSSCDTILVSSTNLSAMSCPMSRVHPWLTACIGHKRTHILLFTMCKYGAVATPTSAKVGVATPTSAKVGVAKGD